MSQANDPNDNYESDGSSALKSAAATAGKAAAKKVGQQVAKKAAQKAGTAAASQIGWPIILGVAAVVILFIGIAVSVFFLLASSAEQETKTQTGGLWGGDISELGQNEIPSVFIPVYQAAQEAYGVPWNLLAAHHRVETHFSTIEPMISPVGALGHMQFMPCTWVGWGHPTCSGLGAGNISDSDLSDPKVIEKYGGYGVDANNDGKADPFDIEDAIFSAASYLAANGAADGNLREAIFAYNRADWYVEKVLGFADSYVDGYVAVDGTEGLSGVEVVDIGRQWIGNSEYVFGGGRNQSDIAAGRFDCSSFVHWAFDQVGVNLGPLTSTTTDTLKNLGETVSVKEAKPGDLVFFNTYKDDGHVGIYIGDGKFIGAQTSKGVAIEDMTSGYWKDTFNGRVKRL
ncbi:bifunctional lytic transglycosylase/C40 family peptidase [Cytobacillus sp. FSL R5-0569]|uniref:C40 family peptidase n=1 Tax=Cytobacillus sp. FSL R5-0569 TaxID=2921649 RepID=UPI0030F89845